MPMMRVLAVIFKGLYLRGDIPPPPAGGGDDAAKVLKRSGGVRGDTVQNSSPTARKIPPPTA
jgi:hypothetical protein